MNTQEVTIDITRLMNGYLDKKDWRVKENANVGYSLGGLILHNSGGITANYWLENIYNPAISEAHRNGDLHIHDLSMFSGYCAGWSLRQLIVEGLGGVPHKITSGPARHLSTLIQQMVNFLGVLQNEWAGAQAFSSFDTYLAPFIKVDNLSYKEVKQSIQSFVFGVNTPSRWGCVDKDTEVLSINGFKKYNELTENDNIYTWNKGKLEIQKVNKVIIKDFKGKLHSYKADNYNQTVTPEHRVLIYKHNSTEDEIKLSEEIFNIQTPHQLPTKFSETSIHDIDLNNDKIMLAAMIYTDGSIDIRNDKIHKVKFLKSPNRWGNNEIKDIAERLGLEYSFKTIEGGYGSVNVYSFFSTSAQFIYDLVESKESIANTFVQNLSKYQATLFLETWAKCDGCFEKLKLQYDNETIKDQLQQIALHAGYTSYLKQKKLESGKYTNYVKLRKYDRIIPKIREEIEYDDIVWCPNVDNGTAVFRKDGNIFISGQSQAPFTNITLDWMVPSDLRDQPALFAGEIQDFTYADCQKEMDMINRAFLEIMIEGDYEGRGFAYPIPTYNITDDFDWDHPNVELLFNITGKYGTPYFQNFINSPLNPNDVRSMCCRLQLDKRELRNRGGGLFGSDEFTGSIGVVTLNFARIGYLSSNKNEFYKRVDYLMDIAKNSLEMKREVITQLMNQGLFPYSKKYLRHWNNHFSTIGLIGMNEGMINFMEKNLITKEAQDFSKDILTHMRDRLIQYQEETGHLYNLEATPGEGTSHRLARIDREKYPEMIIPGNDTPYYTNSTQLPVNATDDVFEALDMQHELQQKYTGGTVMHVFLGESIEDAKTCAGLVRSIAQNYRIPYFTISPTYSICATHGYIAGEQEVCPTCNKPTEVYSRIVGYYRPVKNWNAGKKSEYLERKVFKMDDGKVEEKDSYSRQPIPNVFDFKIREKPEEVVASVNSSY